MSTNLIKLFVDKIIKQNKILQKYINHIYKLHSLELKVKKLEYSFKL